MKGNFWQKLKKPVMSMAPMSGVTDEAFRLMLLKYGRPGVFWTEFVSADSLVFALSNDKVSKEIKNRRENAKKYCLEILNHSKKEKPIVAQIFGAKPENIEKACAIIAKMGFDGIDINMGCPDRAIETQGAGAALIKAPALAKEIIKAAKKGAGKLPISVKTRIGYSKNEIKKWMPALLQENIAVLTVHFRTKKEMYYGSAHWELAGELVALRDKIAPSTLVLGNGEVKNLEQAKKLAKEYSLDGVMVGRAMLGNPWFFCSNGRQIPPEKRMRAIIQHAKLFERIGTGNFHSLKKHFHAYAKDFFGAKDLREKLMKVKNAQETENTVKEFLFDKKIG